MSHSPLSLSRGSLVVLCCCYGVICISEVIDISPHNLDSSLWFIQPSILHDVLSYKLNKQNGNIQPWYTPFPILNQSVVPYWILILASWPAYRFLRRQVRWSDIPISLRIFHSLIWSTHYYWHTKDYNVLIIYLVYKAPCWVKTKKWNIRLMASKMTKYEAYFINISCSEYVI